MVDIPSTFIGLNEWNKRLFEKLGWMYLIKSHIGSKNNEFSNFALYKIKMYKKEVKFLGFALVNKYNKTTEEDRKEDLKILMKQNLVLQEAINMLLESIGKMNLKVPMALIDSETKENKLPGNKMKLPEENANYMNPRERSMERNPPTGFSNETLKKNMYEIYKDLQNNDDSSRLFIGGSKRKTSIKKTSRKKPQKAREPARKTSKKPSRKTVRKSKK